MTIAGGSSLAAPGCFVLVPDLLVPDLVRHRFEFLQVRYGHTVYLTVFWKRGDNSRRQLRSNKRRPFAVKHLPNSSGLYRRNWSSTSK